jgi:hypothetical protein
MSFTGWRIFDGFHISSIAYVPHNLSHTFGNFSCLILDISIVLNLRVKVRGLLPEGILTKDICSKPD